MKVFTIRALPILFLFLSGCAHYSRNYSSGRHYNVGVGVGYEAYYPYSYNYNNYRSAYPYNGYYDRNIYIETPVIHEHHTYSPPHRGSTQHYQKPSSAKRFLPNNYRNGSSVNRSKNINKRSNYNYSNRQRNATNNRSFHKNNSIKTPLKSSGSKRYNAPASESRNKNINKRSNYNYSNRQQRDAYGSSFRKNNSVSTPFKSSGSKQSRQYNAPSSRDMNSRKKYYKK